MKGFFLLISSPTTMANYKLLLRFGVSMMGWKTRVCVAKFLPLRTRMATHPRTSLNGWCVLSITLRD